MSDQERLREIAEREQRATKGPWTVAPCSDTDETRDVVSEYEKCEGGAKANWIAELDAGIDFESDVEGQIEQMSDDAEFIAAARSDVPFLLSLVSRQAQEIQDLRTEHEMHVRQASDENADLLSSRDALREALAALESAMRVELGQHEAVREHLCRVARRCADLESDQRIGMAMLERLLAEGPAAPKEPR